MIVSIPFDTRFAVALHEGVKVCTSRTKRYGKVGNFFRVDGMLFEITGVQNMPLHIVATYLYTPEGAISCSKFTDIWESIHPRRGYRGTDRVWVHWFRRVNP